MLVGSIGLAVVGLVCAREVASRSLKRDSEVRESEGLSLKHDVRKKEAKWPQKRG